MSKTVKKAIFILIFSEFLICLGISIVIPVMPFLRNELHLSAFSMGVMNALFAFAQFVASPIIGRISDRIGRKPILVLGLFLFTVSEYLFAVTNQLVLFDISRVIGGISAAMVVPTEMALAADITTKKYRARVIGWLSAAFSGGLILGPGLGGLLANIDYKLPFWVAGTLGIVSMVAMYFTLPKKLEEQNAAEQEPVDDIEGVLQQDDKMMQILGSSGIILFVLIFISSFGLQGFESIYSLFVNQVYHFSLNNIALVLTLNGILSLFLQVAMFDWLVSKLSEKRLIRYCFLISLVGTIWILLAKTKVGVILATLLVFEAFDLIRPAITTMLTKISPRNQGFINGLNMSLTSVGNVVGPLISGALLDLHPSYPYMIVAVFLGISYILTFTIKSPRGGDTLAR
ncbi:major facilitator superfamily permease [Ligilactobacillus acidipiscis DSM 15836]|uniref:MFS transporter n=2 Tax=Ligilactobacillus acidipiscis TaxID=89059 RepID=A0A921K2R8_9LACO|nr:MFS transporter [Ligilactobacillus acidipiscis]KRM31010.1 major facilitator superfamily permease [Ligilactobacillus acidipiscis DSM 15836]WEV57373.1 MFS transporter [Ligilactobacillus acidipiscis]GAW63627.1 major facilitator superfamily transporter [Ligilactobacillus acidipiscis]GEN20344.1 tetracycline resistance MFS efflux pump [Ligilactobacillus acidipiscis]HJE98320.1 MFS transporter [Ligilactobacillus acidipiscis]